MTLALDTSALLGRYLSGPHRPIVLEAMAADPVWCASALAQAEALGMVDRVCDVPTDGDLVRRALRDDWERFHIVPVDQRCLDRAAELTREQPLRTVDQRIDVGDAGGGAIEVVADGVPEQGLVGDPRGVRGQGRDDGRAHRGDLQA